MNLNWKKLSDKNIRINRFRTMRAKRYRLPNGHTDDFFIFGRGRVIAALVLTRDGKVVIAKQFRPGPERVLWELPGGKIDAGETPRQAAIREVEEEVGYRGKVAYLGKSGNDAWSDLERHHFLITEAVCVAKKAQTDEAEVIEPVVVSITKLLELIRKGMLSDSETAYRGLQKLGVLRVNKRI